MDVGVATRGAAAGGAGGAGGGAPTGSEAGGGASSDEYESDFEAEEQYESELKENMMATNVLFQQLRGGNSTVALVRRLKSRVAIPHELVVQASHQVAYDAAWMIPGARLVPVGRMRRTDRPVPDGGYLAEDCDCTAEEFDAAITDDTAAVLFAAECKSPTSHPPRASR